MKKKDLRRIGILVLALVLAALPGIAGAEETYIIRQGEEELFTPAWDGDPQTLFAGYVKTLFYGTDRQSRSSETVGSFLTGNNAILYGELKRYILEMADGQRASTVIEVSPDIFGVEGNDWTAEELGVEAIVVNNQITNEAVQAVQAKFYTDFDDVLEALLRDCSYEMFWYDKTQSTRRTTFNFRASTVNGETRLGWYGVYTIRFPVSAEYASAQYTIDTAAIQQAKSAAATAKAIVQRYAGATDLEKLEGYKQEICDLATYNTEAAGDSGVAFGNPWQMIWVFDGDPETSVVCEGYAKAFQYLCEQTRFNGRISCVLVDGYMGTESWGGHMWNVLRMDDGKSYIADVTNCDIGSIGSPDLLFLSGCDDGSVEEGYWYFCKGTWVGYAYSNETLAVFPESWLEMSAERYVAQETQPDPWENLYSLILPADTVEIEESAFEGADMERVILPEGIAVIGDRAFALCAELRYVNLPESLVTISDSAFSGCENLTVLCEENSKAEAYALAHGLAVAYVDADAEAQE